MPHLENVAEGRKYRASKDPASNVFIIDNKDSTASTAGFSATEVPLVLAELKEALTS